MGDKISEGDILAEIETHKATMEFEAFTAGTLLHIGINEGETAPVDSLLAIIGKEGEDISALLSGGNTPSVVAETKAEIPIQTETQPTTDNAQPVTLPKGVVVVTMPR